jgi:hypothetical protein
MSHTNIEFAHIYSDKEVGDEQRKGALAVSEYLEKFSAQDTFCLTTLIDEYHPRFSKLIITDYIDFLENLNVRPHYVVMEGDLRPLAYKLLYTLPKNTRGNLTKWLNTKDNFPCSLLTATWYLARLGAFNKQFPILEIGTTGVKFEGDKIVTVLPVMYKENEKKAVELIEASNWSHYKDRIEYIWISV